VTNFVVADTRSKTDERKNGRGLHVRRFFCFVKKPKMLVFIVTGPRAELLLGYKELTD